MGDGRPEAKVKGSSALKCTALISNNMRAVRRAISARGGKEVGIIFPRMLGGNVPEYGIARVKQRYGTFLGFDFRGPMGLVALGQGDAATIIG